MVPSTGMPDQEIRDIVKLFAAAIDEEVKKTRTSERQYSVSGGTRLSRDGSRILYRFSTKMRLSAKDDSECVLIVSDQRIPGQVVTAGQGNITISVCQDLGAKIAKAKLTIDETQLLKQLRSALNDLTDTEKRGTWHAGLANRTLGSEESKVPPYLALSDVPQDLTADQKGALATVFKCETTFLWGPPGTGKTHTLGAIAYALYKAGQRVLIVSHTNQAVDGVVESLCKRLTCDGAVTLEADKILRLGPIVRDSLRERWGEYISFDRVLEQKQQEIDEKVKALNQQCLEIGAELERLEALPRLWSERDRALGKIEKLNRQMTGYRGAVRRLIGCVTNGYKTLAQQLESDFQQLSREQELLRNLHEALKGVTHGEWEQKAAELEELRVELRQEISHVEETSVACKTNLLSNAQVIATNTTQAFLRGRQLADFDVILIDEASMVPLPIAYYLSGIPRHRVVIAGDFRQLPPIAQSDEQVVKEWYAKDIFTAAKVVDDVNARRSRSNLAKLTSQFRSHSDLCALINQRFYEGDLTSCFTDRTELTFHSGVEYLRDNRVVLIDTSDLDGSGQYVDKSKSNLMHALLIGRLSGEISKMGDDGSPVSLGVIAPYRPQVELIQGLLADRGLAHIPVGTVHRFQGDERSIMVLDLTESTPHKLGGFFQATSIAQEGARLLNVALSRAQRNLIVIANLRYFNAQLRSDHVLKGVLNDIEARGYVLRSESVTSPEPQAVKSDKPDNGPHYFPQTQYFNANEFAAAFRADVKEAQRELVVVSAFVSASRVKAFRDILADRKKAGVDITVIVPPQKENGSIGKSSYEEALAVLRELGVRVLVKNRIHSKVVGIDREIVWIGSLNPLSYNGSNSEVMVRDLSPIAYASALDHFKYDLGLERAWDR